MLYTPLPEEAAIGYNAKLGVFALKLEGWFARTSRAVVLSAFSHTGNDLPMTTFRRISREIGAVVIVVVLTWADAGWGEVRLMYGVFDEASIRFEVYFSNDSPFLDDVEFQLFLDIDRDEQTGYGRGFELLVRGLDNNGDGVLENISIVETTCNIGPCHSGGWGRQLGLADYQSISPRHLQITVPIDGVNLSDGDVQYGFETYLDRKSVV